MADGPDGQGIDRRFPCRRFLPAASPGPARSPRAVRVRRSETPRAVMPVLRPSRGPGPRPAPMWAPRRDAVVHDRADDNASPYEQVLRRGTRASVVRVGGSLVDQTIEPQVRRPTAGHSRRAAPMSVRSLPQVSGHRNGHRARSAACPSRRLSQVRSPPGGARSGHLRTGSSGPWGCLWTARYCLTCRLLFEHAFLQ